MSGTYRVAEYVTSAAAALHPTGPEIRPPPGDAPTAAAKMMALAASPAPIEALHTAAGDVSAGILTGTRTITTAVVGGMPLSDAETEGDVDGVTVESAEREGDSELGSEGVSAVDGVALVEGEAEVEPDG